MRFDKNFWDAKYQNNQTGWDIGYASTPIKTYIDQLQNKDLKILVPGAGNGYEVEYLFNEGFKNITVIDISEQPLKNLQQRLPNFPKEHLIHTNFFDHNNKYDLILEQTFFCALDPNLRIEYVAKMYDLLKNKGKLVGLLFDFELTEDGPPFGGSLNEYLNLFAENFKISTLERCYNSIKPRNGNELFFIFEKN
ncbi:methyltransferase [Lutibacter sp. HS1-25]|nr:methyltransferase [Lutibacter sp. HS1-25]RXP45599.1 methyltransferase [Lutibacter sp. HS1-25]